jgi:hypothetical protein
MPKSPRVTARQMATVLEKLGFSLTRQSGSHQIYKNAAGNMVAYCTSHMPNAPLCRLERVQNRRRQCGRLPLGHESVNLSLFGVLPPFQENELSRNSFGSWLPVASPCFLISIFEFRFSTFHFPLSSF